jgi:hypothetical protein
MSREPKRMQTSKSEYRKSGPDGLPLVVRKIRKGLFFMLKRQAAECKCTQYPAGFFVDNTSPNPADITCYFLGLE